MWEWPYSKRKKRLGHSQHIHRVTYPCHTHFGPIRQPQCIGLIWMTLTHRKNIKTLASCSKCIKILCYNSTQSSSLIVSNLGIASSTKLISSTTSFQSLFLAWVGPCIAETIPITDISPSKPIRVEDCFKCVSEYETFSNFRTRDHGPWIPVDQYEETLFEKVLKFRS